MCGRRGVREVEGRVCVEEHVGGMCVESLGASDSMRELLRSPETHEGVSEEVNEVNPQT